jgi:hypothetical protein
MLAAGGFLELKADVRSSSKSASLEAKRFTVGCKLSFPECRRDIFYYYYIRRPAIELALSPLIIP